jgi:hypothetical protein
VVTSFYKELSNLKRPYTYLFPERDEDEELDDDVSLNYSDKQAFIEEYGVYMEMIYIICNGDLLRTKEVTDMPASQFLFFAEYLLRKRDIESQPTKTI